MRAGALIYPLLSAYVPLTSLVSASKIFAVRALQPTTEGYIVYREISGIPTNTNGPDSPPTTDAPRISERSILDTYTVQVSAFAGDYLKLENIAVAIRQALDREWGNAPATYVDDIALDSCVYESCVDDYDDKFGDKGIFIKHLDFTLRVNRINIENQ